jgi:hypothetical protein
VADFCAIREVCRKWAITAVLFFPESARIAGEIYDDGTHRIDFGPDVAKLSVQQIGALEEGQSNEDYLNMWHCWLCFPNGVKEGEGVPLPDRTKAYNDLLDTRMKEREITTSKLYGKDGFPKPAPVPADIEMEIEPAMIVGRIVGSTFEAEFRAPVQGETTEQAGVEVGEEATGEARAEKTEESVTVSGSDGVSEAHEG